MVEKVLRCFTQVMKLKKNSIKSPALTKCYSSKSRELLALKGGESMKSKSTRYAE